MIPVFDNSCCKRCFISLTCDFLAGGEQLFLMRVVIPWWVHSSEVVTHPSSELIVVIVEENRKASPLKQHTESSILALHMPDTPFCPDALQVYFIHPSLYTSSATPYTVIISKYKLGLSCAKLSPASASYTLSSFQKNSVIIQLLRLLRCENMKIWKINWKVKYSESQYCFANIPATEARIFMKFYMVVNSDWCINARARVVNVPAHVFSRMRAFTNRARTFMHRSS